MSSTSPLSSNSSALVRISDIPNIDPTPMYVPVASAAAIPEVRLPSGHIAAHVTGYEDVKLVLRDPGVSRHVCNEEGGPNFLPGSTQKELLLNLDMPYHARSRSLVTKDFSVKGVEPLRDLVEMTCRRHLKEMATGEVEPDLFKSVLEKIPATVVCQILGIPIEDRAFFRHWSKTIQVASKEQIRDIETSVNQSFQYLLKFVRGEKHAHPDGFIRSYVRGREHTEDPLTDEEFVGVLLGILLGGDHNCLSVMTKIVYTLLSAPTLWQQLVEDPALIPDMVEELIRLIPIGRISTFPRFALRDVDISLGTIRAGTPICPDVFQANRDARVFEDPLRIDPQRKGRPHVQFGYGIHSCMGPNLARMEINIVLKVLTQVMPTLRLSVASEQCSWVNGIVLRRPDELPVQWRGYQLH